MAISILPQIPETHHGNNAEVMGFAPNEGTKPQPDLLRMPVMARPVEAAGPLHRVVSTLVYVMGFGLVALTLHEFFHLVTLQALGGEGFITFDWELGFTHFTKQPSHLWIVQLSGGVLTGAFLLTVFWVWAWSSRSAHNVNMEVAAFAWALGNLAYAPTEMITTSQTLGAAAFGIGFSVAAVLYFIKLMNWLSPMPEVGRQAEPAAAALAYQHGRPAVIPSPVALHAQN